MGRGMARRRDRGTMRNQDASEEASIKAMNHLVKRQGRIDSDDESFKEIGGERFDKQLQ